MIDFKRLDHMLISVPMGKQPAARQFYGEVLGLQEIPGEHPRGAIWFKMADIELHIREEEDPGPLSLRHPAFEVGSLKAARTYLQQQNIEVTSSSKIEGRDRCFFKDPFNNRIELIEFDEAK